MSLEGKLENLLGRRGWIGAADSAPWCRDWLNKFGEMPLGIARPASTVEVSEVIKLCAAAGVPVVPQGGNTSLAGGAVLANAGYHRRSRVETKMHCVKLPGQRLMARDFDRQVAEIQVRIAVLNGYTALGIPVTEAVG